MNKERKINYQILIVTLMLLMVGCRDHHQTAIAPSPTPSGAGVPTATPTIAPATASTGENSATDKWLGQWTGVEGTYLDLSKNGDKYVVKIANLDGPKIYEGVAAGDHIEFQRNGKTESIRATDGKGTGMKWMTHEKNCLVVTVGSEGFCRK